MRQARTQDTSSSHSLLPSLFTSHLIDMLLEGETLLEHAMMREPEAKQDRNVRKGERTGVWGHY